MGVSLWTDFVEIISVTTHKTVMKLYSCVELHIFPYVVQPVAASAMRYKDIY